MPLRRFAAYFVGISVCSTLVFASAAASHPAVQEADAPPLAKHAMPTVLPAHSAQKTLLVATAE